AGPRAQPGRGRRRARAAGRPGSRLHRPGRGARRGRRGRRRHGDLRTRFGHRAGRLGRRPAVRDRAGVRRRGGGSAAGRGPARQRRRRADGKPAMSAGQMSRARKTVSRITFVGAGPGDPGLLTVRAVEVLRSAAVLVVDPEVPDGLLHGRSAVVAAGADVRPAVGEPTDVAKVLVAEARSGRSVGRLVAGDPMTSGAVVGEPLGVGRSSASFEVVPGVPARTGIPAYAGVPLGSVHTSADVRADLDWAALAAAPQPLVLNATATHLGAIAAALTTH